MNIEKKIEPDKIAEAKAGKYEKKQDRRKGRNRDNGAQYVGRVVPDAIRMEQLRNVDGRQAADHDVAQHQQRHSETV